MVRHKKLERQYLLDLRPCILVPYRDWGRLQNVKLDMSSLIFMDVNGDSCGFRVVWGVLLSGDY